MPGSRAAGCVGPPRPVSGLCRSHSQNHEVQISKQFIWTFLKLNRQHSDHFQYTVIRSMADINQNDLLFPFGTLGLARRLGLFRFNFNLLFLFLTGRFNHSWICSILVLPIFQRHWTSFGTSRFSFCCRRFLRLHCPGVKSKTCFFHNMRLEP